MNDTPAIAALIQARDGLRESPSRSRERLNEAYTEVGRMSERVKDCQERIADIERTLTMLRGES